MAALSLSPVDLGLHGREAGGKLASACAAWPLLRVLLTGFSVTNRDLGDFKPRLCGHSSSTERPSPQTILRSLSQPKAKDVFKLIYVSCEKRRSWGPSTPFAPILTDVLCNCTARPDILAGKSRVQGLRILTTKVPRQKTSGPQDSQL